jgi:hypothetical protein
MKKNVGKKDALVRSILALVLLVTGLLVGPMSTTSLILDAVAMVLALTAQLGVCGIYKIFGISTCPVTEQKKS